MTNHPFSPLDRPVAVPAARDWDLGASWATLLEDDLHCFARSMAGVLATLRERGWLDDVAPYALSLPMLKELASPWVRCKQALECPGCVELLGLDVPNSEAAQAVARARTEMCSGVMEILGRMPHLGDGRLFWVPDEYVGERVEAERKLPEHSGDLFIHEVFALLKPSLVHSPWMKVLTDRFLGACVIEIGSRLVPRRIRTSAGAATQFAELGLVPLRDVFTREVWERTLEEGTRIADGTVAAGAFAGMLAPGIEAYLAYDADLNGVGIEEEEDRVYEGIGCWHDRSDGERAELVRPSGWTPLDTDTN